MERMSDVEQLKFALRTGQVSEEKVRLLSRLGHAPARELFPKELLSNGAGIYFLLQKLSGKAHEKFRYNMSERLIPTVAVGHRELLQKALEISKEGDRSKCTETLLKIREALALAQENMRYLSTMNQVWCSLNRSVYALTDGESMLLYLVTGNPTRIPTFQAINHYHNGGVPFEEQKLVLINIILNE